MVAMHVLAQMLEVTLITVPNVTKPTYYCLFLKKITDFGYHLLQRKPTAHIFNSKNNQHQHSQIVILFILGKNKQVSPTANTDADWNTFDFAKNKYNYLSMSTGVLIVLILAPTMQTIHCLKSGAVHNLPDIRQNGPFITLFPSAESVNWMCWSRQIQRSGTKQVHAATFH